MISPSGFQKVLTDEFENLSCMHLLIVTWLHPDLYHANKEMNENELKLTNSREKKKKKVERDWEVRKLRLISLMMKWYWLQALIQITCKTGQNNQIAASLYEFLARPVG